MKQAIEDYYANPDEANGQLLTESVGDHHLREIKATKFIDHPSLTNKLELLNVSGCKVKIEDIVEYSNSEAAKKHSVLKNTHEIECIWTELTDPDFTVKMEDIITVKRYVELFNSRGVSMGYVLDGMHPDGSGLTAAFNAEFVHVVESIGKYMLPAKQVVKVRTRSIEKWRGCTIK